MESIDEPERSRDDRRASPPRIAPTGDRSAGPPTRPTGLVAGTESLPPSPRAGATALPERNLDVLRAVAVLCVVCDHARVVFSYSLGFVSVMVVGLFGVMLFFVHTSLVLMSSLERLQQAAPARSRGWIAAFYVRRAFRIYPLAIVAIVVTVLLRIPPHVVPNAVANVYVPPSGTTLLANLLLVQDLGGRANLLDVLWSLPVEVQMYVLLPLGYLAARRSVAGALAAVVVAVVVARATMTLPSLWRFHALAYAPCFTAGVLAYALHRRGGRAPLPAGSFAALLAAAFGVYAAGILLVGAMHAGWLACLTLGTLIPFVRELRDGRLTRAAHVVATYSYGVYLWHTPAIWAAFGWGAALPRALQWTIAAGLTAGLSWASYHAVEAPMVRVGARVAGRVSPEPLLAATTFLRERLARAPRPG